MFVAQLVHTLSYGDAISGEVLLLKRVLSQLGIETEIFALNIHEKVRGDAKPFSAAELLIPSNAAVVLHYSLGSPLNDWYLANEQCRRVLIYHNLTPVRWYQSYNARVALDLRKGLAELARLAHGSDLVLADSEFNRAELAALGHKTAQVLPLAFDPKRWEEPANAGIASVLQSHGGKNLLCVGRLAPNKCIEDVIKGFYFYHHKIEKKSRLWIVGSDVDTEIYSFELRRLLSELRLEHAVTFVGVAADSELRAFYECSDLLISMSEHEGFCVPLVEAMHFGLPVIAFDAGAVRDTLGEAGVLVGEKSPERLAELINIIVTDNAIRDSIRSAGIAQLALFTEQRFSENVQRLLLEPLKMFRGGSGGSCQVNQ